MTGIKMLYLCILFTSEHSFQTRDFYHDSDP